MTDFVRFWHQENEIEKQRVISGWSRIFDILTRLEDNDRWLREQRIEAENQRWRDQERVGDEISTILGDG